MNSVFSWASVLNQKNTALLDLTNELKAFDGRFILLPGPWNSWNIDEIYLLTIILFFPLEPQVILFLKGLLWVLLWILRMSVCSWLLKRLHSSFGLDICKDLSAAWLQCQLTPLFTQLHKAFPQDCFFFPSHSHPISTFPLLPLQPCPSPVYPAIHPSSLIIFCFLFWFIKKILKSTEHHITTYFQHVKLLINISNSKWNKIKVLFNALVPYSFLPFLGITYQVCISWGHRLIWWLFFVCIAVSTGASQKVILLICGLLLYYM